MNDTVKIKLVPQANIEDLKRFVAVTEDTTLTQEEEKTRYHKKCRTKNMEPDDIMIDPAAYLLLSRDFNLSTHKDLNVGNQRFIYAFRSTQRDPIVN